MTSIDRILDILDNAGQDSPELGYGVGFADKATCWRCHGTPGDGPSGVCDGCRAVLLAEVEPRVIPADEDWLCHCEMCEHWRNEPGLAGYFRGVQGPTSAEAFRAATAQRDAVIQRRVNAMSESLSEALARMSRDAWAFGAGYAIIPTVEFGARPAPAPIVSRRISGRAAQRRRPPAPSAGRCHHGNPRNACRDCPMGRR